MHDEHAVAMMVTRPSRYELAKEAALDWANQTWAGRRTLAVLVAPEDSRRSRWLDILAESENAGRVAMLVCFTADGPLGSLRQKLLSIAATLSPTYAIQWDDDDRYRAARLETQVAPLRAGGSSSCLTEQLYLFIKTRQLYLVDWTKRTPRSRFIPGTVAFRGDLCDKVMYPLDKRKAEDGDFLRALQSAGSTAPVYSRGDLYVRRFHDHNTWDESHFRENVRALSATRDEVAARRGEICAAVAELNLGSGLAVCCPGGIVFSV